MKSYLNINISKHTKALYPHYGLFLDIHLYRKFREQYRLDYIS